jgi:hypothetical protein
MHSKFRKKSDPNANANATVVHGYTLPWFVTTDQAFHALVTTANYAVTWCDSVYCSEDSESD